MNDAAFLAQIPEFISIGGMLKASPVMESGRRIVYFEASNEGIDQQGEQVAAKALADSAGYFRQYGNVDIDHYTLLGPKLGIPNYTTYEIGRPLDVRQDGGATFVKAEIYQGEGPAAEKANMVWSSLVDINPPQRWYPSVAGSILEKAVEFDQKTGMRKAIIKRVRWNNVGLSKTPVNQHVAACATIPVGAFAKCWGASGLDLAKALEAGYGTDSASLVGGASLRRQSLHGAPISYFDFREKLASAMRGGEAGENPRAEELTAFASTRFGLHQDDAAEYVERFMRDLRSELTKRRKSR